MTADTVKFRGVGVAFTAAAGTSTVNNYLVSEARLIDGIQMIESGQVFGDHVSLSVVDVDNTLGYGAGVVLDTFSSNWYLHADSQLQREVRLPYSAEVLAGLYIRLTYVSTGGSDVQFKYNLFAHKYMA
jgi:hypothetical protein